MKAHFHQKIALTAFLLAPAFLPFVNAQTTKTIKPLNAEKKSDIRIEVTEDENGKLKKIEKHYQVGAMTKEEKDKFIDKVLDSLGVDKDKKQTISITMDDGDGEMSMKKEKRTTMNRRDDREPLAMHWDNDFSYSFDSENLARELRRLHSDIKPKAKVWMKDMEDIGDRFGQVFELNAPKAASVRGLNAYSNNPDNGMLNLRFSVAQKGDVTVTVTDTKGKEVAQKEIKDFEGEFVGQVELKKNAKGTLFVTVVQDEDGAVKRIVIE